MPSNPIGQRDLSDILVAFLKLTCPTVTNLNNPEKVTVFGLSATVAPGKNPGTTVLDQLSLHDAIGLLDCFVFQVETYTDGSITATNSFVVSGSAPNTGSFVTAVGKLSLDQIVSSLSQTQVTFSIKNEQAGQPVSWTITGSPQTDTPDNPHLGQPISLFPAKYVFLLLHLYQFTAKNGATGAGTPATLDGNKTTGE
jgi:hypothetical protein